MLSSPVVCVIVQYSVISGERLLPSHPLFQVLWTQIKENRYISHSLMREEREKGNTSKEGRRMERGGKGVLLVWITSWSLSQELLLALRHCTDLSGFSEIMLSAPLQVPCNIHAFIFFNSSEGRFPRIQYIISLKRSQCYFLANQLLQYYQFFLIVILSHCSFSTFQANENPHF